ncbi:MAG: uracil-DNA glycosylase [Paenibacillaceae bacterium]|nr:uracil-DNA glycosylase [Paenibacillaceae bacterium]
MEAHSLSFLTNDWATLLEPEFAKPYYKQLRQFLKAEYASTTIYPSANDVYAALRLTSYEDTKVVILGQDPYHGPGQAHGLSFSVKPGIKPPPSLDNIYKELHRDLGCRMPNNGFLEHWAKQGVLLLNSVLTVRAGAANSHKGKGWEVLTGEVISLLNKRPCPVVFLLWGRQAMDKMTLITESRHCVIKSAHPSPLSAHTGFFGSRPFSKANAFLRKSGLPEIDWQIPDIDFAESSV